MEKILKLLFEMINESPEFVIKLFHCLIALTVIGIGSAIDDFAIGIKSVLKGKQEIGIGDALGSILNELVLFFGVVAVIQPIKIGREMVWSSILFLGVSIGLVMLFLWRKKMTWKEGLLMVGIYAAFIAVEIAKAL